MAGALKHHGAEGRLELFDGATKRRLRDAQPLGGPRKAQVFSHRLEVSQMPEFHIVITAWYNRDSQELFPLQRRYGSLCAGHAIRKAYCAKRYCGVRGSL